MLIKRNWSVVLTQTTCIDDITLERMVGIRRDFIFKTSAVAACNSLNDGIKHLTNYRYVVEFKLDTPADMR